MKFYYPETLPITQKKAEILEAIQHNQVTVIAGDTGSGKTTQLPKICLELLQNAEGIVGCTQPRRVAAMTVSQRVADELAEHSNLVGYKIRFHDHTTSHTRIMFMTDGVLLAETRHDKLLKKYAVLIIDEAHERSLNIDFLIGHVKNILRKRRDLKVVITSATIDTTAFSRHFDNAPVINIPGKTFPIEVRHEPPQTDEFGEIENYLEKVVDAVYDIYMNEPPGDTLVFLPTEKDIRICCEQLAKKVKETAVLPLFGRLQPADQKKIFRPLKTSKIVVATNVAETSITVPGIRYVVDTGLARMAYYNSRSKTHSLPIRKVSRASCDQRKGRCGRVGPGVCIRLYQEEDYLQREEYSVPEIKRSNLAEVILQMLSYKLGDPYDFPFIDPPHGSSIREGYRTLFELGAIDENKELTKNGKIMASLPIDPAIARIIIEARQNNCLTEIMVIATVMAIQDPRVRPADMEEKADHAHSHFAHPQSDFITYLNIWNLYHQVRSKTSWSRLKKFCKLYYLSFQRMREWFDLHEQMTNILRKHKQLTLNKKEASYDAIHKSLAVGFLRNIGLKKSKYVYQGSAGKEVMIFPGSGQFSRSPQWILASAFLETNRLYALNVATIQPEWLETLGGNMCKYSWSQPRYHKKSGQVLASEKVTLFGLVIIASRRVNFAKTNADNQKTAREIFIQSALVEGQLQGRYDFLVKNRNLIKKWNTIEERIRARDIVVNDQSIFEFYESKLQEYVCDRSSLNKFLKRNTSKLLILNEEQILYRKPPGQELADFPKKMTIGSNSFSLHYVFDPTSDEDGVTIRIPLQFAAQLNPEFFDWIVPGLLREKTTFLLKALPKKIRKHLIPLNITVDNILDDIHLYKGSFLKAIENSIFKRFKLVVKRSDWLKQLPSHLQMRISLVDHSGEIISSGRDFSEMLNSIETSQSSHLSPETLNKPEELEEWERCSVKDWNFENLPHQAPLRSPTGEITGYLYPAVMPDYDNGTVTIQFFTQKVEAAKQNVSGMRYLYRLQYLQQYKALKKSCSTALSGPSTLWLINLFPSKADALEAMLAFILDTLFKTGEPGIPSQQVFDNNLAAVPKNEFFNRSSQICNDVLALLRMRNEVLSEIQRFEHLSRKSNMHVTTRYDEYHKLLTDILPQDFLHSVNYDDFEDLKRYLSSLKIRIARAHSDVTKDKKKSEIITPYITRLEKLKDSKKNLSTECCAGLHEYERYLQEFRISLFSPEIKTKFPVSEKKLQKIWQEIEREC